MYFINRIGWTVLLLSSISLSDAATRLDLSKQNLDALSSLIPSGTLAAPSSSLRELSRSFDHQQMLHVRMQQTYAGYPIWNANISLHLEHVTQPSKQSIASLLKRQIVFPQGVVYQQLADDLNGVPPRIFSKANREQALQATVKLYLSKKRVANIEHPKSQLMVYVDKNDKAHWVYKVSFYVEAQTMEAMPEQPTYLIDALTYRIYKSWDNVKTSSNEHSREVWGGGFGGNLKIGRLYYDGWHMPGHHEKLKLTRDTYFQCYLKNLDANIVDYRNKKLVSFYCPEEDEEHNSIYWNEMFGAANGGFSSSNDALFAAQMTHDMYEKWFRISTTIDQAPLIIYVHMPQENAYWSDINQLVYFGDGSESMYPLTTLDVVAHEISHGVTQSLADLEYVDESGAINEAFSDMAGMAVSYYVFHSVNWQIGAGLFKKSNKPLRWLDDPTKDGRSIDHLRDYYEDMNVHAGSGIFNKAFYLLATTPHWDVKKAFSVMVRANRYYWTSTSTFHQAACGVMAATRDLQYSTPDVVTAFHQVGIDASRC